MGTRLGPGDERGAIVVIVTLSLVVLLGFAALAVDLGALASEKRKLVTAVDAGALAGARQLQQSGGVIDGAEAAARDYATANGADSETLVVNPPESTPYLGYRQEVEVIARSTVDLYFAKVLGFSTSDVAARAVATWGYVTKATEIIPFYYEEEDYLNNADEALLHLRPDQGPNWGIYSLSPSSDIKDALAGDEVVVNLEVGDEGEGETGGMQSLINSAEERLEKDYSGVEGVSLIGLVPIVSIIGISGNKLSLRIEGFAHFELQDVVVDNAGNGSKYSTNNTGTRGVDRNHYDGLCKGTVIGRFRPDLDADPPSDPEDIQSGVGATYVRLCE